MSRKESKKLNTISRMDFDSYTGNWTTEVAQLVTDEEVEKPTTKDFTIEKINLGTT